MFAQMEIVLVPGITITGQLSVNSGDVFTVNGAVAVPVI